MGRNHKFAVGITVALLLGAASPALAAPGKGHAWGHAPATKPVKAPKAPKPPKTKPAHLNGGGTVGTTAGGTAGEFSVQVRADKLRQGHFNFTAEGVRVRCRSFPQNSVTLAPGSATFNGVPCTITRAGVSSAATLSGTMTDAGNPADTTPPTAGPDRVDLVVTPAATAANTTPVTINGPVTGNVKVH